MQQIKKKWSVHFMAVVTFITESYVINIQNSFTTNITRTFQNDQRTYSVSSDCCRGLFVFLNGTLSSSEIVCRSLIYKMNKRELVRLHWTWGGCFGHPPTWPTASVPAALRFRGDSSWARKSHCRMTAGLQGLLFMACGVELWFFFLVFWTLLVPHL